MAVNICKIFILVTLLLGSSADFSEGGETKSFELSPNKEDPGGHTKDIIYVWQPMLKISFTQDEEVPGYEHAGITNHIDMGTWTENTWHPPIEAAYETDPSVICVGIWVPAGGGGGVGPRPDDLYCTAMNKGEAQDLSIIWTEPSEEEFILAGWSVDLEVEVKNKDNENVSGYTIKWEVTPSSDYFSITGAEGYSAQLDSEGNTPAGHSRAVTAKIEMDGEDDIQAASPEITFFDVEIEEIRSDQLPGVRANYHPGGSGSSGGKDYLLIAPRSSEDLKFKAKLDITPASPALNDIILVRLRDEYGNAKGESSLNGDIAEVTLSPADYAGVQIGNVLAGIELDGGFFQLDKYEEAYFRVVDSDAYTSARSYLKTGAIAYIFEWPFAARFLLAFVESTGIGHDLIGGVGFVPATVDDSSVAINEPKHNVGAIFCDSAGGATIDRNTFFHDHAITSAILKDTRFKDFLLAKLDSHADDVKKHFDENPGDQEKLFVWSWNRHLIFDSLDLIHAFATVSLNSNLGVTVKRENYEVKKIFISGNQVDMYHWDYDKQPDKDRQGAIVQTGYSTLGEGGHIYRSRILFSNYIENINYNYNFD